MIAISSNKTAFVILAALILISSSPVNARSTDQVVSEEWKNNVETYLRQVDANTTAEIVVYVVQSLRGHGIEDEGSEINEIVKLGVFIFNKLPLDTPSGTVIGIGKKGKDNGVLVLVAMDEREWRIEIGYGLEGYITDIETNIIAQENLVTKFGEGKYGEGLYYTVAALSQKIPTATEQLPVRGRYFYENTGSPLLVEVPLWVTILVIAIIVVVIIVVAYLTKKGKMKWKTRFGGSTYGGGGGSSGGQKGGGGRSGGGGAKGKW